MKPTFKQFLETHQSGSSGGQIGISTHRIPADSEAGLVSEKEFIAKVMGNVKDVYASRQQELELDEIDRIRAVAKEQYDNSQSVQTAVNIALRSLNRSL